MKVLMCTPTYFDVQVENHNLNPWMKKSQRPDKALAMNQWEELKEIYEMLGLEVNLLEPQPGLFDQVFTANLAWGRGRTMVLANLSPEWRRPETVCAAQWLLKNDYERRFLPERVRFEGQGDIISLGGGYFFYCYGIRNDLEVVGLLEEILLLRGRIIPLKLVDKRFYHGDVCLRYSGHRNALLFNPAAFDAASLRKIENLPIKKMEAPPELWVQETERGRNFPLNGCYIGRVETFPWDSARGEFPKKVQRWIEADGGIVRLHNFDQFGLSGAGHRCCTLFLD
jgi:N-dimethylarginine dimethylaminohydrolase